MPYRTGVYQWRNLVNGMLYIGGAYKSLVGRRKQHLDRLRAGTHWNLKLQRAWNKYGASNFVFEILETCQPEEVKEGEQWWIDNWMKEDSEILYNLSPTAGSSLGTKMTDDQRKNYTLGAKKRMKDPVFRAKSLDNLARTSQAKGRPKSEEHKAKISSTLTGRKMPEEIRNKIAASNRGQKRSPEQKERMKQASLKNRENRRRAAMIRWYGKEEG